MQKDSKTMQESDKLRKPQKVELMSKIVEGCEKFDKEVFKASVLGLFNDALKSDEFSQEQKSTIARLYARVQIEL